MELEPSTDFEPLIDRRPKMDEPPPVRLVTVADPRLPASAGSEPALDAFYVDLLGFVRLPTNCLGYRAQNFILYFDLVDGLIERASLRMLGIEVPSLGEAMRKLTEAEIPFLHQRGLTAGQHSLQLQDPAGNWLELTDHPPL